MDLQRQVISAAIVVAALFALSGLAAKSAGEEQTPPAVIGR
ncbi:MAG: hypothetical protein AAF677_18250 [Pseudomonadota bacterium]